MFGCRNVLCSQCLAGLGTSSRTLGAHRRRPEALARTDLLRKPGLKNLTITSILYSKVTVWGRFAYFAAMAPDTECATLTSEPKACRSLPGVVEAGCKIVVAQRLKRAGMHWSLDGANAILALRCAKLSGRFEMFWKPSRDNQLSA